jgi:hypothetical protein
MSELDPIAVEPIHFEYPQIFFDLEQPKCFALGHTALTGQQFEVVEHQGKF